MRRKVAAGFLGLIVFLVHFCHIYAYSGDKHDAIMREVLFGKTDLYYSRLKKDSDEREAIDVLEAACYLCIDYFNTNDKGKKALKTLEDYEVKELPENVEDTVDKGGIRYTANSDHRRKTHKGWEYDYTKDLGDGDSANWNVRKNILKNSVSRVFNGKENQDNTLIKFFKSLFGNEEVPPITEEKVNSISAFLYYIHILGDQIQNDKYEEEFNIVPFIMINGKGSVCIVDEMEKHLTIIFDDQIESAKFKILIRKLHSFKKEAEEYLDLSKHPGGLYDADNYEKYHKIEKGFLKMLKEEVPSLFQKETFFTDVFPGTKE